MPNFVYGPFFEDAGRGIRARYIRFYSLIGCLTVFLYVFFIWAVFEEGYWRNIIYCLPVFGTEKDSEKKLKLRNRRKNLIARILCKL